MQAVFAFRYLRSFNAIERLLNSEHLRRVFDTMNIVDENWQNNGSENFSKCIFIF